MRTIALILTFFCFILVSSQETIRESRLNFRNLLSNPGAENGKSGVAVSNPAHLSISSVAANVSEGKSSFDWQPTAATNSIVFGVADFPQEYANASCLAKGLVRAGGNYSAGLLAIRVKSNGVAYTDDLDIGPVSSGDWKPFEIAFICPAYASGALDIEFEVTAGSVWKIDSLWLGKDYRLGHKPFEGWTQYTEAGGDFIVTGTGWTTNSAFAVPYKTKDGSWRIRFNVTGSTSSAVSGITLTFSGVTWYSGSNSMAFEVWGQQSGVADRPSFYGRTAGSSIQLATEGVSNYWAASGDLPLPSKPTWAEDVLPKETVTLETQGWFIDAYGDSVNTTTGLGSVLAGSFATITNAAYEVIKANPNSADVYTTCDGAASVQGTCPGNGKIGFGFIAPYAGNYLVCHEVSEEVSIGTSSSIRTHYRLSKMVNGTNTVEVAGLSPNFNSWGTGASGIHVNDSKGFNLCEVFYLTSGKSEFALQYENTGASGTVTVHSFIVRRDNKIGNIKVSAVPLTQNFPQAVALPKADWQKRFLQSDIINTATPDISDLRFTGLETNKLYKICYQARMQISGNSASEIAQLNAKHNGVTIAIVEFRDDAGPIETRRQSAGTCTIFKALTNTLVFEHIVNGTVTVISGSSSTFAILEELPWHNNETTKWTP